MKLKVKYSTTLKNHFEKRHTCRSIMYTTSIKGRSELNEVSLSQRFSLEEIKEVLWNCESFKILGMDGINFGF